MLRRKATGPRPRSSGTSKLGRLPTPDLELALETSLSRTAELFRGITHKELDPAWLLQEMEVQIRQALDAVQVLQDRVEN
jgi:hypothetical protein